MTVKKLFYLVCLSLLTLPAACADNAETIPTPVPTAAVAAPTAADATIPTEPATATAIPPSPTPEAPLAARVNGEPIFLADYENELVRYETALIDQGQEPGADGSNYREVVLNVLIDQALLVQAAAARNIMVTPETVDEKLAELRTAAGGAENFAAWLAANQWTEESFLAALRVELLKAAVRDAVTADVPFAVEQVRARYLQVDDADLAQSLLEQALAGDDFGTLAEQNSVDRLTGELGGDLGFFARGTLLVPEVEAAAFGLPPGEISPVITVTDAESGKSTYYLVQVTERDPQRTLDAISRYKLLDAAFQSWLAQQREAAVIEIFVETGP